MPNGRTAIVESHYPGRMRVRLPKQNRESGLISEIEAVVSRLDGIRSVTTNLKTGSILVEYDPSAIDAERLKALGGVASVIDGFGELLTSGSEVGSWAGRCKGAERIIGGFKKFDRSVNWATHGSVDGKMAVALGLLVMSLGRALLSKHRSPTPWHSLLWYSYSVFMHWNRPLKE